MAKERTGNALQIIFSFFLGLMVLALIGVGVNTFYPSPQSKVDPAVQALYRQQEQLSRKTGGARMTPAEQAESDAIQAKIDALNRKTEAAMKTWARNTSIVLILFATLVMSISLIRSEQLPVISNGLLLGGLFTVVYGVGWVIFSGESVARFVVIAFAFVITVTLGYVKFVRQRQAAEAVVGVGGVAASEAGLVGTPADASGLASLTDRVARLEARNAAAAAALTATGADNDR